MQRTVLIYGLIGGLIMMVLGVAHWSYMFREDFSAHMTSGMILGYASMIISLSMVFFGVKQYRDRHLGGKISFGKALIVGLMIAFIGAAFYVITWMVYFEFSEAAQNFPAQYTSFMKEEWTAQGMSAVEITENTAELEKNMELYKNNAFIRAGMTLMEIFPVVLVMSLLSALILKRK